MAAVSTLHLNGRIEAKAPKDSQSRLVAAQFEMDGNPAGNSRALITVEANSPQFSFTFSFGLIEIGDTTYTEDPFTGEWESGPREPTEGDPFIEVMQGRLRLENMTVSVVSVAGTSVYRIAGNLPEAEAMTGQPLRGDVTLWVGIDDSLVRRMEVEGSVPASEYEGLIPPGLEEVFERSVYELSPVQ